MQQVEALQIHQLQRDSKFWEDLRINLYRRYFLFIRLFLIDSEVTALFIDCKTVIFVCWQVHRVLPQWLAQPDVIHRDIKNNLVPLADVPEISLKLVEKLLNHGIQHLFPGNINFCSTVAILMLWHGQTNIHICIKTALTFQQYKRRWSLPFWKVHNKVYWLDEVVTSPEISACLHQQAVAKHWHLSYLLYRWASYILFRLRHIKKYSGSIVVNVWSKDM